MREVDAPQQPPVSAPARSMLIDIVRGLAIMLVALGHTNQGVLHRGWWGTSPVGARLDGLIYTFHMPAFFFVSGIFLRASIAKRGPARFVLGKLRTMMWPYLVFSLLTFAVLHFTTRFTVQQVLPPGEFLLALLSGASSWFLPTIFFCVVMGMLLRDIPTPLALGITAAFSTWYPETHIVFVTRGIKFLPFVVLGMWVSSGYERVEAIPRWIATLAGLSLMGAMLWITSTPQYDTLWTFLPLGALGTAMLLLYAQALGRSALVRVTVWVGEASFGIFLLSQFAQGAARELLLLAHITEPYVQTILPTVCAVIMPAWLYSRRQRLGIAWMFAYPQRRAEG